jgi:aconitate hydratase
VVAYALAGTVRSDITVEPIGIAPTAAGLPQGHLADQRRDPRADRRARPFGPVPKRYADVYRGDERWQGIAVTGGDTYQPGRRAPPTSPTRPISRA